MPDKRYRDITKVKDKGELTAREAGSLPGGEEQEAKGRKLGTARVQELIREGHKYEEEHKRQR